MNLKAYIGKLELNSPLVAASGTFGFGDELKGLADFSSIGAITTKTITLEPKRGNLPPRIYEAKAGVLNAIGLENPGLKVFLKEKLPQLKELKTKCIVSLGGSSQKEYRELIRHLDKKKEIAAFELNLSCPNLKSKKLIAQNPKATAGLIRVLRKATRKTLIAKLTPEVTDITKIAKAAEQAGADALSLVNTYFSLAIDTEKRKPYLGNIYGGYSGPAIKPMSLYKVWQVAKAVKIPVIGGGGITGHKDALEFFLAGAEAVSLGTVNFIYPDAARLILKGVKNYLAKNKIKNLSKLRRIFNESTVG